MKQTKKKVVKDYIEITCQCGRRFTQPYFNVITNFSRDYVERQIAPSEEQIKAAHYRLTQDIIYHQNRECHWMYSERKKVELATTPPSIHLPSPKIKK